MSEKKNKKFVLTANSLKIILLVLMLLIIIGGGSALTIGLQAIKAYAIEVSHKKVDASASNGTIFALQKTQSYLDSNEDVLQKIGLLRASSEFPEFKVVDEVRSVAAKNNIKVDSFNYGSDSSKTSSSTTAPSTATPTAPAATVAPSSGKTIALSVTFTAPSYLQFLQFTYDLEQHLPKMKINGIGVSSSTSSSPSSSGTPSSSSSLTIDPITVEMYINQ